MPSESWRGSQIQFTGIHEPPRPLSDAVCATVNMSGEPEGHGSCNKDSGRAHEISYAHP